MFKPRLSMIAVVLSAGLLAACGGTTPVRQGGPGYYSGGAYGQPTQSAQHGRVSHIETMRAESATTGAGGLIGGVVGAVVGRQFGSSGNGRAAGTVVGAVGGAIIGNQIEKNQKGVRDFVRVTVQLDNGAQRSFDFEQISDLRVGDHVRVENDQLTRW